MNIQEIEVAIMKLPVPDMLKLATWLADYQQHVWDREIEDDLETGRLDSLLAEVEAEYKAGQARPL
ncbi:MAG: hypothetical protein H6649_09090 [Caldilineae bacterium]|nr:hypothetical protein [Anaerolineae bacterium]MCB9154195.1 hypothetical protein [Caldilineae bacterium]